MKSYMYIEIVAMYVECWIVTIILKMVFPKGEQLQSVHLSQNRVSDSGQKQLLKTAHKNGASVIILSWFFPKKWSLVFFSHSWCHF